MLRKRKFSRLNSFSFLNLRIVIQWGKMSNTLAFLRKILLHLQFDKVHPSSFKNLPILQTSMSNPSVTWPIPPPSPAPRPIPIARKSPVLIDESWSKSAWISVTQSLIPGIIAEHGQHSTRGGGNVLIIYRGGMVNFRVDDYRASDHWSIFWTVHPET